LMVSCQPSYTNAVQAQTGSLRNNIRTPHCKLADASSLPCSATQAHLTLSAPSC
jgi:hypothetical protein